MLRYTHQTEANADGALGVLDLYESAVTASPLLTKSVTSLLGFAIADLVAQRLSKVRQKHAVNPKCSSELLGLRQGRIRIRTWLQYACQSLRLNNSCVGCLFCLIDNCFGWHMMKSRETVQACLGTWLAQDV